MKLYRFQKFCDKKLSTFRKNQLWYSSPREFNDPADCRLELAIDSADRIASAKLVEIADSLSTTSYLGKTLTSHLISLLKAKKDNPQTILDILQNPSTFPRNNPLVSLLRQNWLTAEIRDWILDTTAVCCFVSSDPLNPLMWAHYANGHRGFCIEYDADLNSQDAQKTLFAINYMTERPHVTPEELLIMPSLGIRRVTASKDNVWAYEREYRIVLPNALRKRAKKNGMEKEAPEWLKPVKIISGARIDNASDKALHETACLVGIDKKKVVSTYGNLAIEDNDD